jgi:hypothetical protein
MEAMERERNVLPPAVIGSVKGEVRLVVDTVLWRMEPCPSSTQVRVKWWGDTCTKGTLFSPVNGTKGLSMSATSFDNTVFFPIVVSEPQFRLYLKDMRVRPTASLRLWSVPARAAECEDHL